MPTEMTPAEAAKTLASSVNIQGPVKIVTDELKARAVAVDCLRKLAAGELREVVHGHFVIDDEGDAKCSVCGAVDLDCTDPYCPYCGASMDAPEHTKD